MRSATFKRAENRARGRAERKAKRQTLAINSSKDDIENYI